jgi:tRNA A-37 threonylcarbamoyl transferase component Bud32
MTDAVGNGVPEFGSLIGQTLANRYVIQSKLGKGGMAVVYKAKDKSFGRDVAVKVLRTDVAKDPVAAKRLIREARAAGQLHHPNIITMHDVGEVDGLVYIVMEVLKGRELSDLMEEEGAVDPARAVEIARQVASAMTVAHANGIIHRDIKPENLFLNEAGGRDAIKVLDFSIAKLPTNMVTAALTRVGSVFGTPHYMAPEQVEGRAVCSQTDLYALGAVLYELIAGEPPFDGKSVIDILLQHAKTAPPKLSDTDAELPPGLSELVDSLLAKKETDRPASAEVVEQALARFVTIIKDGKSVVSREPAATVVVTTGAEAELITAEPPPEPGTQAYVREPKFTHVAPEFGPPPDPAPDGELADEDTQRIAAANEAKTRVKAVDAPEGVRGSGVEATAGGKPTPSLELSVDLPDALSLPDAIPNRMRAPFAGSQARDDATLVGAGMAQRVREETERIKRERAAQKHQNRQPGDPKPKFSSAKSQAAGGNPRSAARPASQRGRPKRSAPPGPSRKVKVNVPPPPGNRAQLPSVSAPGSLRTSGKLRLAPRSAQKVRQDAARDAANPSHAAPSTVEVAPKVVPPRPDTAQSKRASQNTVAVTAKEASAIRDAVGAANAAPFVAPNQAAEGHKKLLIAAVVIAVVGLLSLAGAAALLLMN